MYFSKVLILYTHMFWCLLVKFWLPHVGDNSVFIRLSAFYKVGKQMRISCVLHTYILTLKVNIYQRSLTL